MIASLTSYLAIGVIYAIINSIVWSIQKENMSDSRVQKDSGGYISTFGMFFILLVVLWPLCLCHAVLKLFNGKGLL